MDYVVEEINGLEVVKKRKKYDLYEIKVFFHNLLRLIFYLFFKHYTESQSSHVETLASDENNLSDEAKAASETIAALNAVLPVFFNITEKFSITCFLLTLSSSGDCNSGNILLCNELMCLYFNEFYRFTTDTICTNRLTQFLSF